MILTGSEEGQEILEIFIRLYDRLKFLLQFLVEVILVFHIVGVIDFLAVSVSAIAAAINSLATTIRFVVEFNAAKGAFHRILLNGLLFNLISGNYRTIPGYPNNLFVMVFVIK